MQDVFSPSSPRLTAGAIAPGLLQPGSTLFCDFDGPIADVSERYYRTYQLALAATQADSTARGRRLPIRQLTKGQFWHMKQNRVPDTTIADWSGLTAQATNDFLAHVATLVNQTTLLHLDQVQPGSRSALISLHDRGVRIVIVTLRQASQVFEFLRTHDLATTISQIYGAQDTSTAYPNRTEHKVAQLSEAIADQQRLGFSTVDSWMIGDTEADIVAGKTMSLPTVGVTCGIRSAAYLRGFRPTRLYRDLQTATDSLMVQHSVTLGASA